MSYRRVEEKTIFKYEGTFSAINYKQQKKYGLTKNEYRLVDYIFHMEAEKNFCFAKPQTIAKHLNLSSPQVYLLLRRLQHAEEKFNYGSRGDVKSTYERPAMLEKTNEGYRVLVSWKHASIASIREPHQYFETQEPKQLKLSLRELELLRLLQNTAKNNPALKFISHERKFLFTSLTKKGLCQRMGLLKENSKYIYFLLKKLQDKGFILRTSVRDENMQKVFVIALLDKISSNEIEPSKSDWNFESVPVGFSA